MKVNYCYYIRLADVVSTYSISSGLKDRIVKWKIHIAVHNMYQEDKISNWYFFKVLQAELKKYYLESNQAILKVCK